jgi:hypothetical protein
MTVGHLDTPTEALGVTHRVLDGLLGVPGPGHRTSNPTTLLTSVKHYVSIGRTDAGLEAGGQSFNRSFALTPRTAAIRSSLAMVRFIDLDGEGRELLLRCVERGPRG